MKFQMPRPSGGSLGRTKNILHFTQAFIIFIAWAMTIAIWTKGDGIDGRTGWYWGLVSCEYPGNRVASCCSRLRFMLRKEVALLTYPFRMIYSVGSVSPVWST